MNPVRDIRQAKPGPAMREAEARKMPAAPEVEAALLYVFSQPTLATPEMRGVMRLLMPDHFFVPKNARAFEAMKAIVDVGGTVDAVTLAAKLQAVPGPAEGWRRYITETIAAEGVHAEAPPAEYARILLEKWRARETIRACSRAVDQAFDGAESLSLIDEVKAAVSNIADTQTGGTGKLACDALRDAWSGVVAGRMTATKGLPWAWPSATRSFGLMREKRMSVLAAVPGVGKTNIAWHQAEHIANMPEDEDGIGEAVYFVSGELLSSELMSRQGGIRAGVSSEATEGERDFTMEEAQKLAESQKEIETMSIIVDDNGGRPFVVSQLEAKIRDAQTRFAAGTYTRSDGAIYPRNRLRFVVVDYLTKMLPPPKPYGQKYDSREREVAAISGALTELAKVLNVHVLAIAAVSRSGVKNADDKKRELHMSDLRESGAIEYDAANIIFANCPDENVIRLRTDKQRFRKAGFPVDLVMVDGRIFEMEQGR